jgi:hypothetical protein
VPLLLVGILAAAVALSAITGLDGLAPKRAKGPGGANTAGFARGGGSGGGPRSALARAASAVQNFGFGVDGPSLPTIPEPSPPVFSSASVPTFAPAAVAPAEVAPPVFTPYTGVDPVNGAPLGGGVMVGTDPAKGGLYQPPLIKAPDGAWVYPDQLPYHQVTAPASTPASPSGYTAPPPSPTMAPPPATTLQSAATAGPVPDYVDPFAEPVGVQPIVGGGVTGHGSDTSPPPDMTPPMPAPGQAPGTPF